jgi:predicted NACHT family NTPase
MLEIFDSIGMGRSLLILGVPGSGKTTMLLELARQLIARAREDVTYLIPPHYPCTQQPPPVETCPLPQPLR